MSFNTTEANQWLDLAAECAREDDLPYKGALPPPEAYELLRHVSAAVLVDVRTQAELDWVGQVQLPDAQWQHIEWNTYPAGNRNQTFAEQLATTVAKDVPVLFLCRSGARSHQAAVLAAQLGYRHAINILEGFEGDKDTEQHRGRVNGWRKAGLPWRQN
ncbi:MAG: rhodanese-like domain-containing protein [Burkholderiaceae bacterium]|jgi:rhodanese-related sulfurtransferase